MEYTPLADPFMIRFEKDGVQYEAKVVYGKSTSSCANLFNVEICWPRGIEPFCLKEKQVHHADSDAMVWVDEQGRESVFYQMIGNEIAGQLKAKLGIFLMDAPVSDKDADTESY